MVGGQRWTHPLKKDVPVDHTLVVGTGFILLDVERHGGELCVRDPCRVVCVDSALTDRAAEDDGLAAGGTARALHMPFVEAREVDCRHRS